MHLSFGGILKGCLIMEEYICWGRLRDRVQEDWLHSSSSNTRRGLYCIHERYVDRDHWGSYDFMLEGDLYPKLLQCTRTSHVVIALGSRVPLQLTVIKISNIRSAFIGSAGIVVLSLKCFCCNAITKAQFCWCSIAAEKPTVGGLLKFASVKCTGGFRVGEW